MKDKKLYLSHKIVSNSYYKIHGFCNHNYYDGILEEKNIALLIIINLHLDSKISDKKMFAMFKKYNDGTLLDRKNTYHCNINDKWYDNESMFLILCDCYDELCDKRDFDIETMLKYLNLLLNKNRNYCIDFYYTNFIEPIINKVSSYTYGYYTNDVSVLSLIDIEFNDYMTYDDFKDTSQASWGYCCSDCDGCLSQYKEMQYTKYLGFDFKEKLSEKFNDYLCGLKKNNYSKNIKNIKK